VRDDHGAGLWWLNTLSLVFADGDLLSIALAAESKDQMIIGSKRHFSIRRFVQINFVDQPDRKPQKS